MASNLVDIVPEMWTNAQFSQKDMGNDRLLKKQGQIPCINVLKVNERG